MLDNFRKLVKKRNGHAAKVNGTNGHELNGHNNNGHAYCHGSDQLGAGGADSLLPESEITVSNEYSWSLEVRNDDEVLGTMHSRNPFVLISFFRDYTVFHGDPTPPYAVWLRHQESDRGAPMTTQYGEEVWLDFLRQLDPEIDDHLDDTRTTTERSSMFDEHGRPTNPDSLFERAFGVS
jgi:hypothetical protein